MQRFGFCVLSLLLVSLGACAINDQRKPGGDGSDKENPIVVMETSMGTIKMELFAKKAPISVENFLKYVDNKHYDDTIFHRVIPGFMVQGGGFEPGMREKRDKFPPIKNEAYNGLTNDQGTLAMARTNVADSATSQFFVNVVDNGFLNRAEAKDGVGYAVFGKVIDGMKVVDKIRYVRTAAQDVPVEDVIIKSIRRVE
ncbi:MAG: peptidyl-prolyl cis-trans isomerase [Gemmataceae bacterium]|nr:peptidyl-prolyl cis-trans isomerase [Gemmataceae bacterium]